MADVKASVLGNSNQGVATWTIPADFDPATDRTLIPLLTGWSDSDAPVVLLTPVGRDAGESGPYVIGRVTGVELVDVDGQDEPQEVRYDAVAVGWGITSPEAADSLSVSFLTRRQQG